MVLRRIHLTGQWLFLKVEALFNLAFGDRLNPLYYLGPISYYLMRLVVISGLYLYAFFETSVSGAYDSVEALTHGQWWAGGVLRSVHRYASDGVVITISPYENPVVNGFLNNNVKHFTTRDRERFVLQLFERNVFYFLYYLKEINN